MFTPKIGCKLYYQQYINIIKSNRTLSLNTKSSDILKTPLQYNQRLSKKYNTQIYYKREDLQNTRSFKIRGAFNKIKNNEGKHIITASAGNHAQGVAYLCNKYKLNGTIYVPEKTPLQKINRIKYYGENHVSINIVGKTFNDTLNEALEYSNSNRDNLFIHPYNDQDVINGQGTIAKEIFDEIDPDIIIAPIGGGGLISGIVEYVDKVYKKYDKKCAVIGVEPKNADSMNSALLNKMPVLLKNIDTFVDGASVSIVGDKTYKICQDLVDDIFVVSNGNISNKMIDVYQNDGIILEPAGALSLCVFDELYHKYGSLENKKIISILSGGNNDISRYNEIIELNQRYLNLRHYFILEFSQKPGELSHFINNILEKTNDIIRFEYIKKTNGNYGNVLIGIEVSDPNEHYTFINRLNKYNVKYKTIGNDDLIYKYIL